MTKKIFHYEGYGKEWNLYVGQKVECIYYHEYENRRLGAYQRSWLSKLIDKPFKPVKFGVIIGDGGIYKYWLDNNEDKIEQYLLVKFKEYYLPKPIPISCIKDAKSACEQILKFLEDNECNLGQKGYSYKSFFALKNQAEEGMRFVNSK